MPTPEKEAAPTPRGRLHLTPNVKPYSLKGLVMLDTTRGVPRVRIWPGPRGREPTPTERAYIDLFRLWTRLYSVSDPRIQTDARKFARLTRSFPRDIWAASMHGTLWALTTDEGVTIYPMQAVEKVSESLDVIAQFPGSLLVRGEKLWFALTPGAPGQILSLSGDPPMPTWTDPPGAGDLDRPIHIPISSWETIPGGSTYTTYATARTARQFRNTTTDGVATVVVLPQPASAITLDISVRNTAGNAGNVRWVLYATVYDPPNDPPTPSNAVTLLTTTTSTGPYTHRAANALPLPASGRVIHLYLERTGPHPDDSHSGNVYLLHATLDWSA
jgi:hypothetical protein